MIKIFPIRFIVDTDSTPEQVWDWINVKIKESKITQITPVSIQTNAGNKKSNEIKCLIEVHSPENITTSELATIFKPYPPFIQQVFLTFQ